MQLIVVDDYEAVSRLAADHVSELVAEKPDCAIVWPVGNTPVGAADELTARKERGEFDPSKLRIRQLDEYVGCDLFYQWLHRAFLAPLGIPEEHVLRLRTDAEDLDAVCSEYDQTVISTGGLDLVVFGLGLTGHFGFNEPPTVADDPTRVVTLLDDTIESNASYWGGRDKVPPRAITAGPKVLFQARKTLLLVSGADKHDILRKVLLGPVTPDVPASLLQNVANVIVIADRAAAGDTQLAE